MAQLHSFFIPLKSSGLLANSSNLALEVALASEKVAIWSNLALKVESMTLGWRQTLFDEESYLHQANQILYLVDVLKFFVRFCDRAFF